MSQENVDAVRAIYEEWARGNFRAGVELYDARVLYVPLRDILEAGHYVGPEGVRQYMSGQLQAWETLTITAEEFVVAGDSVVATARWRGVGRESGAPVEWEGFHVWSFRGRNVIRLELFGNHAEALEAVGLAE